jgi:nitrate reductase NapE component|tara:strand:+ start:198 stop:701 length:504 start_codon:yes stop_codon:yes gene_type:complete
MIAETLAGISLLKASVDFIKSNINTAKDIGEIASAVDGLFRGHDEVQAERSKKSKMGVADQFGIKSVAQEMIDAKLAQEKMQEMKNMINMRFGPDTWQSIVDERAKRIQEAKEAALAARRQKQKEQAELIETIKMAAIIGITVIGGFGALIWVLWSASAGTPERPPI